MRRDHETYAMSWDQRIRVNIINFFSRNKNDDDDQAMGDPETGGYSRDKKQQYRLEASRRVSRGNWRERLIFACGLSQPITGPVPNHKLAGYLHWMFRVNFVLLFTVMCIAFFVWVIFFAGLITLAGRLDSKCIRVGGEEFGVTGTPFADAFSLSWTTFSTVGYGSTYPALGENSKLLFFTSHCIHLTVHLNVFSGYQQGHNSSCFFINFICSLEALVGVLYSGFCGAILFSKVLRIQSQAQVIFSDPIVVRFGSGVVGDISNEDLDIDKIPCPVLEFRVVNRLFSEPGGEIMDATLNVVANIDAEDRQSKVGGTGYYATDETDSESLTAVDTDTSGLTSLRTRSQRRGLASKLRSRNASNDDPSNRHLRKHIFSKMSIEASDHPFFKRVWVVRHILDENSPILRPRVRRQVRRNDGYWPERLNNASDIRESLCFNQILVSLNGVSNVSASDVFSQKIYDYVDVNIGYQFVNILYKDQDGSIGVDTELINDVREQRGGGGEPLVIDE